MDKKRKGAPPPGTTFPSSIAIVVTPTASSNARDISSVADWVGPLIKTDTAASDLLPVNLISGFSPTLISSTLPLVPKSSALKSSIADTILAPVEPMQRVVEQIHFPLSSEPAY